MTPADFERARSWLPEIADLLLHNPTWTQDGDERKYSGTGGLHINLKGKGWFDHGAGTGGQALKLVQYLLRQRRRRSGYSDAVAWLTAFLANHPGTGSSTGDYGDGDDATPASAAECRDVMAAAVDPIGTRTEIYLTETRGISGPYPSWVKHIDNARVGEGAFVAALTANDRVVGVQETFITPDATKSLAKPARRRLNLETSSGAVFRTPPPDPAAALDSVADYMSVEGAENALALGKLGRNLTILGLPGVGTLRNLDLPKGSRLIHVSDGKDEPDIAAAKNAADGVDALIANGVLVRVTQTPAGEDANTILQRHGLEALRELCARPLQALPSVNARIIELSRIEDPFEFAKLRKAIASTYRAEGVTVGLIDDAVKKLRPPPKEPTDDAETAVPPDPEWEDDVDLAAALDSAVKASPRFLQAPAYVHDTIALWSAMTHLVHSEDVALTIAPQLAFQSTGPNSGKSVALEVTATLSGRGHLRSSYSAATLFRKITQDKVTPCLSELHNVMQGVSENTSHMLEILNACHRRSEAFVDRCEADPQTGMRFVVSYPCWAALAWTSIGAMHPELQSRAIALPMRAALPDEFTKIDTIHAPRQDKELIDVRRQFAKFAQTVKRPLTAKTMPPHLFNRIAVNWRPLFALAEMAGGEWPRRMLNAVEEIGKVEVKPPLQVRLLTSISAAFVASFEVAQTGSASAPAKLDADKFRLPTNELLRRMCADEEAGWDQANRGRPIDEYWLRENLRGLIDPPKTTSWHTGTDQNSPVVRGYYLSQFKDAFLRLSIAHPVLSATSTTSATEAAKPAETADVAVADAKPNPLHHPLQQEASKSATNGSSGADVPDVADEKPHPIEKESIKPNGHARRMSDIDRSIIDYAAAHPAVSAKAIVKKFGQPPELAKKLFPDRS